MNNEGLNPNAEEALTQVATPDKSVIQPEEPSLVDEIIFGTTENAAFEPQVEDPNKVEPTEVQKPDPVVPSTDETQYQYWQSQTDKERNEKSQLKVELDNLKAQVAQQTPVATPQKPEKDKLEEFPAPPEKPAAPAGFSKEEAYGDPMSASAQYLQTVEGWRDDMLQYNNLKSDYVAAVGQYYRDQNEEQAKQRQEAYSQEQRQRQVMDDVRAQVVGKYGADQTTVDNFIKEMSDPQALSIENLWKLYNLNHGASAPASTPSPDFRQIQQTQTVPSPMGVLPSATTQANSKSPEDMIMDGMINDYKGANPFG